MREKFIENTIKDENITYRGATNTRLDTLTDAVFGIALALLIFNVSDADSFGDLLLFAKSFPALLLSIVFLYLIWKEHVNFSIVYGFPGFWLEALNVIFIALVIFYVYPLRFLTRLMTELFFNMDLDLNIKLSEVPDLMIFYGLVAFSIYLVLFFFYFFASRQKQALELNAYEVFYTKQQSSRMLIMAFVPIISVLLAFFVKSISVVWASVLAGFSYNLYLVLNIFWTKRYAKRRAEILAKNIE